MRLSIPRLGKLKIADEVARALQRKAPVVALESTIITHGLPYPQNLEMAQTVETIIRQRGAVPATIAFLNGVPTVGLNAQELSQLARTETGNLEKVSRRDIPYVMARGLSGGTTIAGTMILAHQANIRVFATGGLGGVHRDVQNTWDISADLEELSRTPVGVVCSGPKSILDIPKTIEYLETKGVHVSTLGPRGTNIPGFYVRDSGVKSPFNFQAPGDAAKVLHNIDLMELNNGTVFCVPAPEYCAMPKELIDGIIENALFEAEYARITGKDLTPFLLKKIWEATEGKSVQVNVEFVKNNARIGADIAGEFAKLQNEVTVGMSANLKSSHQLNGENSDSDAQQNHRLFNHPGPSSPLSNAQVSPHPKALMVGSIAQDITCTLDKYSGLATSYRGKIQSSIGGVGYNVARAANYILPNSVRLVSCIGTDFQSPQEPDMDMSGLATTDLASTARYVSMNDNNGDLVVACADMDAVHNMSVEHITKEIDRAGTPEVLFFDGNIGTAQKAAIISNVSDNCIVGFEPTSVPKAADLARLPLRVYPEHQIDIALPNVIELDAMFEAFHVCDKFDVDMWFPVIDALGVNEQFRLAMENMARTNIHLSDLVKSGIAQKALHLLPYIPILFVKNGPKGVVMFQLVDAAHDMVPVSRERKETPTATLYVQTPGKRLGVVVEHFPAYDVPAESIVSVSGAGDTFCGVLIAELCRQRGWLKDPVARRQVLDKAQWAASLSLQTLDAVSKSIRTGTN